VGATSQQSSKHIKMQQIPSELEGYFLSNETGKALEEQLKNMRLQTTSLQSEAKEAKSKSQSLSHHILHQSSLQRNDIHRQLMSDGTSTSS
jgi:hypothetical protein